MNQENSLETNQRMAITEDDCQLQTYIECNFNWTHGGHPFDPNSEEDQAQLQARKEKDTKFYQVAVDVWTRRDPNKMKIALDNNLRFKVFWTIDDVNDWLNHLNVC